LTQIEDVSYGLSCGLPYELLLTLCYSQ